MPSDCGEAPCFACGTPTFLDRNELRVCDNCQKTLPLLRALCREALAALREHDAEYHYVTPPDLLARLEKATGA